MPRTSVHTTKSGPSPPSAGKSTGSRRTTRAGATAHRHGAWCATDDFVVLLHGEHAHTENLRKEIGHVVAAVTAGLTAACGSGAVKGPVNRIKMIKDSKGGTR